MQESAFSSVEEAAAGGPRKIGYALIFKKEKRQ